MTRRTPAGLGQGDFAKLFSLAAEIGIHHTAQAPPTSDPGNTRRGRSLRVRRSQPSRCLVRTLRSVVGSGVLTELRWERFLILFAVWPMACSFHPERRDGAERAFASTGMSPGHFVTRIGGSFLCELTRLPGRSATILSWQRAAWRDYADATRISGCTCDRGGRAGRGNDREIVRSDSGFQQSPQFCRDWPQWAGLRPSVIAQSEPERRSHHPRLRPGRPDSSKVRRHHQAGDGRSRIRREGFSQDS